MITTDEIKKIILAGLPGSLVEVSDTMGTGDHFELRVESKDFAGKSLMDQHKMVFAILRKEMDDRIHAVQIKTKVLSAESGKQENKYEQSHD